MFILQLNDMRAANSENLTQIVRAKTPQQLEQYLKDQRVEDYTEDNRWKKSFAKGELLEWYNPPSYKNYIVNVETADKWAEKARKRFEQVVMSLPTV